VRYFIQLSYRGTNYHGWQFQPNSRSIQEDLELAFSTILREEIKIVGAGRTDTGVHASFFIAHFEYYKIIDDTEKLIYKLNSFLSRDISIHKIFEVKENSHARFDAISRSYKYYINERKNPFYQDSSFYYSHSLNINLMNEACKILFKHKNFTSFSKLHTDTKTNNCKILYAQWTYEDDRLCFTIEADRFLRNMVRAIVGTMIDIGTEKISNLEFEKIIESKNRSNAGFSVPPQGLFLTNIKYPKSIF